MERRRNWIVIALVGLWVAFTVTLAAWWLIFGLRQLDLINQSNLEGAVQLHRHYQMLLWEGGILIVSLIGGGMALFYYARREQKRHAQVEEFFAAFTHDAKTALASLRLQAESLREDFAGDEPNPLLDRLLGDTLRLQLQLENSLFLVNLPRGKFTRNREFSNCNCRRRVSPSRRSSNGFGSSPAKSSRKLSACKRKLASAVFAS